MVLALMLIVFASCNTLTLILVFPVDVEDHLETALMELLERFQMVKRDSSRSRMLRGALYQELSFHANITVLEYSRTELAESSLGALQTILDFILKVDGFHDTRIAEVIIDEMPMFRPRVLPEDFQPFFWRNRMLVITRLRSAHVSKRVPLALTFPTPSFLIDPTQRSCSFPTLAFKSPRRIIMSFRGMLRRGRGRAGCSMLP